MRIFSFILLVSIVASCTVQKRVHRPGWHVEWNKNYRSSSERDSKKELTFESDQAENTSNEKNVDHSIVAHATIENNNSVVANTRENVAVNDVYQDEAIINDSPAEETSNSDKIEQEQQKAVISSKAEYNNSPDPKWFIFLMFAVLFLVLAIVTALAGAWGWLGIAFVLLALMMLIFGLMTRKISMTSNSTKSSNSSDHTIVKEEKSPEVKSSNKKKTMVFFGVLLACLIAVILMVKSKVI